MYGVYVFRDEAERGSCSGFVCERERVAYRDCEYECWYLGFLTLRILLAFIYPFCALFYVLCGEGRLVYDYLVNGWWFSY